MLGIDPDSERDLLWIAREGILAPLPPAWTPVEMEDGQVYFYNQDSGQSLWEHPLDSKYRDMAAEERKKKALQSAFQRPPQSLASRRRSVSPLHLPAPSLLPPSPLPPPPPLFTNKAPLTKLAPIQPAAFLPTPPSPIGLSSSTQLTPGRPKTSRGKTDRQELTPATPSAAPTAAPATASTATDNGAQILVEGARLEPIGPAAEILHLDSPVTSSVIDTTAPLAEQSGGRKLSKIDVELKPIPVVREALEAEKKRKEEDERRLAELRAELAVKEERLRADHETTLLRLRQSQQDQLDALENSRPSPLVESRHSATQTSHTPYPIAASTQTLTPTSTPTSTQTEPSQDDQPTKLTAAVEDAKQLLISQHCSEIAELRNTITQLESEKVRILPVESIRERKAIF